MSNIPHKILDKYSSPYCDIKIKKYKMATYSKKDFDSSLYNSARPSYPDEFYQHLMEYHQSCAGNSTQTALDVGCGSGFVAFKLAEYFEKVVGTDISETMILQCKGDERNQNETMEFAVAPAEKAPDIISPASVDMITAAECLHWVDQNAFFEESARILKPNGTLAYWFYLDPVFPASKEATQINLEYSYDSSIELYGDDYEHFFGPYYEQPGHNLLRSGLDGMTPPTEQFADIIRHYYDPFSTGSTPLLIKKKITLEVYGNYVKSWSGYNTWKADNPEKPDAADELIGKLQSILGEKEIDVVFPTLFVLARRK